MEIAELPDDTKEAQLLPVTAETAYYAEHGDARAVFEPGDQRLRVLSALSFTRGHFKELMDRLTAEIGCSAVRFVCVTPPDDPMRLKYEDMVSDGQGRRHLEDAVDGFAETWEFIDGERVRCLQGTWNHGRD